MLFWYLKSAAEFILCEDTDTLLYDDFPRIFLSMNPPLP